MFSTQQLLDIPGRLALQTLERLCLAIAHWVLVGTSGVPNLQLLDAYDITSIIVCDNKIKFLKSSFGEQVGIYNKKCQLKLACKSTFQCIHYSWCQSVHTTFLLPARATQHLRKRFCKWLKSEEMTISTVDLWFYCDRMGSRAETRAQSFKPRPFLITKELCSSKLYKYLVRMPQCISWRFLVAILYGLVVWSGKLEAQPSMLLGTAKTSTLSTAAPHGKILSRATSKRAPVFGGIRTCGGLK